MKQMIASLVEKRIPFFQKLIRIPSVRGGEGCSGLIFQTKTGNAAGP